MVTQTECNDRAFECIKRYKYCIQAFWVIATIGCSFFALDLPNLCVFEFLPPDNSESAIAYQTVAKYFPDLLLVDVEVIVIAAKWDVVPPNNTIVNNETRALTRRINDSIWHDINPSYELLIRLQTFYDTENIPDHEIPYDNQTYDLRELITSVTKPKYVDEAGDVMLVYIESDCSDADTKTLAGWIGDIKAALRRIGADYPEYDLKLTGGITIFQQSMQVIQRDITSKDLMTLPVIFCLMIYMIGSWKLVGLPGVSLGMTIVISFGIIYPFSIDLLALNPMGPSVMMFLAMALSIDYSMFLLSRFAKERREGKSVEDAVREMLRYSAHVVLLSGTILCICYSAVVMFPVAGFQTVGYGAVVAILVCMLVNVSMTAASILTFPNYYGNLERFPSCLVRGCAQLAQRCSPCAACCGRYTSYGLSTRHRDNHEQLLAAAPAEVHENAATTQSLKTRTLAVNSSNPMNINGDVDHAMDEDQFNDDSQDAIIGDLHPLPAQLQTRNCYFRMTQITTRWPYNLLCPLLVYCCMLPGIWTLTGIQFSIDFTMNFPQHVESVDAYNTLISDFNPGDLSPFYILVVAKDAGHDKAIWNETYFHALCAIGSELVDRGYEGVTQMTSIGFVPNKQYGNLSCLNDADKIAMYEQVVNDPQHTPYAGIIHRNEAYYRDLMQWFNNSVNQPQQTVSLIRAIPNFNPFTSDALQHCLRYREAVNAVAQRPDIAPFVDVYLHNSLFWEIDSLHRTNETLPYALTIISVIVFLIIGLVFRSVFLPLRLLLCVVIPILFVYGVVTGVYQHGWLDWMHWQSVQDSDGIYWMLPVITCTVLMGLALDYEIFLFSRVYEYRCKGFKTRAAIVLGVSSTGPIISAAGCVMAMAFGGLLLENIVSSNQMGMVFVFGVLVDTFVVRPILVPSILSFADAFNWWPAKMPMPVMDEYEHSINLTPLIDES